MLVDRVDFLRVPGHNFDAGLLRAVSREELVIRLEIQHAGRLARVDGRPLVQMPRVALLVQSATDREGSQIFIGACKYIGVYGFSISGCCRLSMCATR